MLLRRLDLIAFGPFTGQSLDFGSEGPRLHVIYGANEAGKSSALRALGDCFYGIPLRSSDDHQHEAKSLRVGAELMGSDGRVLQLVRRKGRKDTLLDVQGAPLDESRLGALLGGVTRGLFDSMFGLSHESLRAGAQALLEGQGDVGESLFGASLGSVGLHETRLHFQRTAEQLFTERGRTGKLINGSLERIRQAKETVRLNSTSAQAYLAQRRELERLAGEREDLKQRRQDSSRELAGLDRILNVLPSLAKLESLQAERQTLARTPVLGEDAPELRRSSLLGLELARAEVEREERERVIVEQRLRELGPPEALEELSLDVVEQISAGLGRARAARVDLPKREVQYQAKLQEARNKLARVRPGWPHERAQELRLSTAVRARLKSLGQGFTALRVAEQHLTRELGQLEGQLCELASTQANGSAARAQGLERALRAARTEQDVEQSLRQRRSEIEQLSERLESGLVRLSWYWGEAGQLAKLPWPAPETVRRLGAEFDRLSAVHAELEQRRTELEVEQDAVTLDQSELTAQGAVPSEAGLLRARQDRNEMWQQLRGAFVSGQPQPGSALQLAGFEERLLVTDQLADQLRREADRVGRAARLIAQQQDLQRRLAKLSEREQELRQDRGQWQDQWQRLWDGVHTEPHSPLEMLEFLAQVHALEQVVVQRARTERELEAWELERTRQAQAVERELTALGVPPHACTFDELIDQAERVLADLERTRRQHNELTGQRRALSGQAADLRRRLVATTQEKQDWHRDWAQAVEPLGLGPQAVPEEVMAMLEELDELMRLADEAEQLLQRAKGMRRDSAALAEHVEELSRRYLPRGEPLPVVEAAERLVKAHGEARRRAEERTRLQEQLAEIERVMRQRRHEEQLAQRMLERLLQQAGASDVVELEQCELRSARCRELERQLAELSDQLVNLGAGLSVAQLRKQAQGINVDVARARQHELREELESVNEQLQTVTAAAARCEVGVQRLDAGAADAEQNLQGEVAQARGYVERYVRYQLANVLLQREIEKYRERNQGPILKRAAQLFPRLSAGRYRTLKVAFDAQDRQHLVCVRQDGSEAPVEGLSDGTRDQLYLSLRLASLERLGEHSDMLPLVLDDILIHFDDQRARAALEVLGEFSLRCQILFFTHHTRLVELASSLPRPARVVVHQLAAPAQPSELSLA